VQGRHVIIEEEGQEEGQERQEEEEGSGVNGAQ
jgi:hypothetical protein